MEAAGDHLSPLTAQEANLIHLLYGNEAHKQDQDKGSSWGRHIYAGVAAPWDDLMSKLTLKATWKQNPHGQWLPVYHITDGKPHKQPQKRAQPAFDPEVEDHLWRDLTEACSHPPQKKCRQKSRGPRLRVGECKLCVAVIIFWAHYYRKLFK